VNYLKNSKIPNQLIKGGSMKKSRFIVVLVVVAIMLMSCTLTNDLQTLVAGTATPTEKPVTPTPTIQPTYAPAITVNGDIGQLDAVLINLYQKVSPGIVSIICETSSGWVTGTGFVYDDKGHILTSYHVVDGANTIEVDFPSGLKVPATIQASDLISDIAVLKVKVDPSELHPLEMGESDSLNIGQLVVAIGNPFFLNGSMTLGIVSAKNRILEAYSSYSSSDVSYAGDIIQTDAAINPGNSGGPLFNLAGQVIGLNRAISTTNYTSAGEPSNSGVGFAVSANIINKVVPELIANGEYTYPYMGIYSPSSDFTLADWRALDIDRTYGVYVGNVEPGGPADKAGLIGGSEDTNIQGLKSGGDLILAIDSYQVLTYSDLISYLMSKKSPGDEVVLQILRNGEIMDVKVTLGDRKD
jgi:S1-C subfamily serine protease